MGKYKPVYMFTEDANALAAELKKDGEALKNLLGGKGANLNIMMSAGLPVPPGFTVTTEQCIEFMKAGQKMPAGLDKEIDKCVAELEKQAGKKFGDPNNPLLVSVRSGARDSMPG
ncbi:MAG: pyruvate, phosphate dikinase, partial [Armatimonadetes bacterium]|nr:pyruvate, phosphate dikinase [Armatimonadota bacterium]